MPLVPVSDETLDRAARTLRAGQLVAFPTETVYGLGAVAFDATAVAQVFAVKERPSFDPLIVHLASAGELEQVAVNVPEAAHRLARRFWPGPLTLVLGKSPQVPPIVTAGLDTVAVRVPAHPVARELIRRAELPIAAPSANLFGRVSPTRAEHVLAQLGDRVPLILDGGPCPIGVESTVLHLAGTVPVLLRPGGLPVEEIEAEIGTVRMPEGRDPRLAPGQLDRHYAPRIPLTLVGSAAEVSEPRRPEAALLAFGPTPAALVRDFLAVENLSERGDLCEAAARLFAALHRLEGAGCKEIFAVRVPEHGLGRAILDRLRRAACS